jgi:hypothetical protein
MSPFLQQMHEYFRGERIEAFAFIVPTGLALLVLAGVALKVERGGFAVGLAVPLVVFGLALVATGAAVGLRTPAQIAALESRYQASTKAMVDEELPRMRQVNRNWPIYLRAYVIFVLLGLALRFLVDAEWARGVGPALILGGAVGLLIDGFAERRAQPYTAALEALARDSGSAPR